MSIQRFTMKEQKPFNKLQIIKSTIIKKDKLFKAQLEMAKKHQI